MAALLKALLLRLPETVETERLVLRATRGGMGPQVAEAVRESRGELERWMAWAREARGAGDSEVHCREMQLKWHAREELDFCFHRRDDGLLVGKGGLHTIDWTVPRFEIGYWIRSSCLRRGYASEAALGLVGLARSLGARRLEINTDARNVPSRGVAERCGFELEGVRRNSRRDVAGRLTDACMYARVFDA